MPSHEGQEPTSPGVLSKTLNSLFGSEGLRRAETSQSLPSVENMNPIQRQVNRILGSSKFQLSMGCLVACNFAVIVAETDARVDGEVPKYLSWLNYAFLLAYTIELIMRIVVETTRFLLDPWNLLDTVIVLGGLADPLLTDRVPDLTMLRLLSVIRLLRAAKLLAAFPQLYSMLQGLWSCFVAMSWGLALISLTLLAFSVASVDFIRPLNGRIDHSDEFCVDIFDSVFHCMIFLFRAIVMADSWGACIVPIINQEWGWSVFFLFITVFVQMCVLNLILSVIVESANKAMELNKYNQALQLQQDKKKSFRKMKRIFRKIDTDQSKTISWAELDEAYRNNPELRQLLTLLDCDEQNLAEIFSAMDHDGSGCINYNEFTDFMRKAQMTDVKIQMMSMRLHVDRMQREEQRQFTSHHTMIQRSFKDITSKLQAVLHNQQQSPPQDARPPDTEQPSQQPLLQQLEEAAALELRALKEALAEGRRELLETVDTRLAVVSNPHALAVDGGLAAATKLHTLAADSADDGPTRAISADQVIFQMSTGEGTGGIGDAHGGPARALLAGGALGTACGFLPSTGLGTHDAQTPQESPAGGRGDLARAPVPGSSWHSSFGDGWPRLQMAGGAPQQLLAGPLASYPCFPGWQGGSTAEAGTTAEMLGFPVACGADPSRGVAIRGVGCPTADWADVNVGLRTFGAAVEESPVRNEGEMDSRQSLHYVGHTGWSDPQGERLARVRDLRLLRAQQLILQAGMTALPFDKLVISLDQAGMPLTIHEQDALRCILHHGQRR